MFTANHILEYKILLSKSKLPTVVEKKNKAIAEIVQKYKGTFVQEITAKQFTKRSDNMKTCFKKIAKKKTGNKLIKVNLQGMKIL